MKTCAIKYSQLRAIAAITIGSHQREQRRKTTSAVTVAITRNGVRGWLYTTKAKITSTQAIRARRCLRVVGGPGESGAVTHATRERARRRKRPPFASSWRWKRADGEVLNQVTRMAIITRYRKKSSPCGEK